MTLLRIAAIAMLPPIFALAAMGTGFAAQPEPWRLGLQEPATNVMEGLSDFHNLLVIIITAISVFVMALLLWVMWRYRESANPVPSKTSHNTTIEVLWTIVPVLILVVIAIPSFRLLYAQNTFPPADVTIKTTGYQWYWNYEYPDHGIAFDSYMIEEAELKPGQPRLLAVDNEVVVPVNKVVHVLIAAADVMHNWMVPAFGVKQDAIPGRINRVWFQARQTGIYYGECSELCGSRHAYMPIAVRVVSEQDYAQWLEAAKQKFASKSKPDQDKQAAIRVAAAD